jgi:beta-glucosidase
MISGGGSAQVDPIGGNAIKPAGQGATHWMEEIWFPTSPLKAIQARAPRATVKYDAGTDPAAAAAAAKGADVAIVFAYRWASEGMDMKDLTLPHNQDAIISAVAEANPHTIVVLETGNPVTMPWVDKPAAILEAWFAGSDGASAVGNVLFGTVNPSGKLVNTFPKSEADLPHPTITMPPKESTGFDGAATPEKWAAGLPPFPMAYDEGVKVGYKWYDAENKKPLFPFGFGLSYTTYGYSGMTVTAGDSTMVTFTVKNKGKRAGTETAQVYASLPEEAGEPPKRLVGWARVDLGPGESKQVSVPVSRERLEVFDEATEGWKLVPGKYVFRVGGSSRDLALEGGVSF